MCTRFALRDPSPWASFVDQAQNDRLLTTPRYNVAPSQNVLVIKRDANASETVAAAARWGFVPSWQRGIPKFRPTNARDDRLLDNRMFRASFDRRRCLVPADGFYEWLEIDKVKQPFFFHLAGDESYAFAGFYDTWTDPKDGETADRMTFCTTSPNDLAKRFHDRMPVLLRTEAEWQRWLDPSLSGEDVIDMLGVWPDAGELGVHAVDRSMGNSRHDSPAHVDPIPFDIHALPAECKKYLDGQNAG